MKTVLVSTALAVLTLLVLKNPPKAIPPVQSTPVSATNESSKIQQSVARRAGETSPAKQNP